MGPCLLTVAFCGFLTLFLKLKPWVSLRKVLNHLYMHLKKKYAYYIGATLFNENSEHEWVKYVGNITPCVENHINSIFLCAWLKSHQYSVRSHPHRASWVNKSGKPAPLVTVYIKCVVKLCYRTPYCHEIMPQRSYLHSLNHCARMLLFPYWLPKDGLLSLRGK